jgi:E3 ubiquitin-protein ligase HUWE1
MPASSLAPVVQDSQTDGILSMISKYKQPRVQNLI